MSNTPRLVVHRRRFVPAVLLSVGVLAAPALAQSESAALRACADQRRQSTQEADAEKRKQQTDAVARHKIALRNCGNDAACKSAATRTYHDEQREIANRYTEAAAAIRKVEIDCQQAARSGRGAAPAAASRDEMIRLRAELNEILQAPSLNPLAAAGEFFRGLLDWAAGTLQVMADRPGRPVEALVDYLVNHRPESFAQQFERGERALREFQDNPAYFLGKNAPNFVPMPAPQAAAASSRMVNAGRRLTQLNAEANRFAPVGRQLLTPTRNLPRAPLDIGPPPLAGPGSVRPPMRGRGLDPPPYGNSAPSPRSGIPPTCYENQCFKNTQAVADYWETGQWVEPSPRGYPLAEELSDLPTISERVIQDLRHRYGGARAKDPFHGDHGQLAHSLGIPVSATKESIEQALGKAGPGAQGRVFVQWERQVGSDVLRGGHVVNVRALPGGGVEFFDRATQGVAHLLGAVEPALWRDAREIFFFRTH